MIPGVEIAGPMHDRYDEVLTDEALDFLATLHRRFQGRRRELLELRAQRYAELAAGGTLNFLPETKDIREDDSWRVPDPAPGLVDRRTEITGPTDRKMTINALNSGARVWLADLEDANTPLWENMVSGQLNLRDAIERRIDFTSPEGKTYALRDEVATIVVRPRGGFFLLPNGTSATMPAPSRRAPAALRGPPCHKRGAHAIGGMAAFIPS